MSQTGERPAARYVEPREALAFDATSLRYDAERQAFFWLFGPAVRPNERRGDVAVVHVRGPLEHHADAFGDSYEDVLVRVGKAMSGQDVSDAHERDHQWEDGYEPMAAEPPRAVVLCLDSPGGVVAGLNETVFALQRMSAESGVRLIAYVNELAASAAFALACSCEEILLPPSAIIGSCGVISTMVSQARANDAQGIDVVLLTSGARKADGHVHAPITDAAIAAEQARVDQLAKSFFSLVSKARGLSVDKIRSYEAAIFLGQRAVDKGFADDVLGWDDVLLALSDDHEGDPPRAGNVTDRRAKPLDKSAKARPHTLVLCNEARADCTPTVGEDAMPVKLDALIKKTEAAIAAESDPKKRLSLLASLDAYKKTKKHVEHYETEEDEDPDEPDDDDGDDGDEDDEDDEAEEKKSAKKSEEEEAKNAKKSEEEEAKGGKGRSKASEEDEEEEEEEAKSKAMYRVAKRFGAANPGELGALLSKAAQYDDLAARVGKIERKQRRERVQSAIASKLAAGFVTPHEARQLRADKDLDYVEKFLAKRTSPVVASSYSGDDVPVPDGSPNADMPADVLRSIDLAVASASLHGEAADKMREAMVRAHREKRAAANGVGRY